MKKGLLLSVCMAATLFATIAAAESQPTDTKPVTSPKPAMVAPAVAATEQNTFAKQVQAALREQQAATAELRNQVQQDKAHIEKLETELAEQKEMQAVAALSGQGASVSALTSGLNERLRIFGFFDVSLAKYFIPDDSPQASVLPRKSTFAMTNINLYVQSTITENIEALLEFRYSFLPHGAVLEADKLLAYKYADGSRSDYIGDHTEFKRIDTTMVDSLTTLEFPQHSLSIERAHINYRYREWLNILVGRFLTPVGIWNIDHGSPVLLMTRLPYMLLQKYVPIAQTGIQIHGRTFLPGSLALDYAATISNGRGPAEAINDLDEDKALGGRLKLSWMGNDLHVSLGTHLYFGKYTDTQPTLLLDVSNYTFSQVDDVIEEYDEFSVAGDLLVEYKGIRLQSEFIHRRVMYQRPLVMHSANKIYRNIPTGDEAYEPDYCGNSVYGLLAYELPWTLWGAAVIPVAFVEWNRENETAAFSQWLTAGGVNIRPSPQVVLKIEYLRALHYDARELAKTFAANRVITQVAVKF